MGHSPPQKKKSESLRFETTGPNKKSRGRGPKWYGHPLSSCNVWWRSAAARRREKEKWGVFVLFVCLFITFLILARGLVIKIAIVSPFVGRFLCGFYHF